MCYRRGRGVVPPAGIRPGQMIVKFRGLDMSRGRPRKSMTWQETVGGPNGAQRSEFRRTAPPDGRHGDEDIHHWKTV